MVPVGCFERAAIASLVCAVIAASCSAVMAQNDLRLMRVPDPLSGENPPLRLLPQEVNRTTAARSSDSRLPTRCSPSSIK